MALIPPRSISAPFYGYLKLRKATRKGKKSKQGYEVIPGNQNRDVLAPQQKRLRVIATVFSGAPRAREARAERSTMGK